MWWVLQASTVSTSLNCHGNTCRTPDLVTKLEILNEIEKGDGLQTDNNAVLVIFVGNSVISKCSAVPVDFVLTEVDCTFKFFARQC